MPLCACGRPFEPQSWRSEQCKACYERCVRQAQSSLGVGSGLRFVASAEATRPEAPPADFSGADSGEIDPAGGGGGAPEEGIVGLSRADELELAKLLFTDKGGPLAGHLALPPPLPPHRAAMASDVREHTHLRSTGAVATAAATGVAIDGVIPGLRSAGGVAPSSAAYAALAQDAGGEEAGNSDDDHHDDAHAATPSSLPRSSRRRIKKMKTIIGESLSPEVFRKQVVAKNAAARELIETSLCEHFFFSTMGRAEIEEIVEAMSKHTFAVGETATEQGELGDNFYIVETGHFDVFVKGAKVGRIGVGGSFGELALLYNSPRAATVKAAVTSQVWALDRRTFRHIVADASSRKLDGSVAALRKVPLLQDLTTEQVTKVAMAVQEIAFRKDDVIIRKGDRGDAFYFLREGAVVCTGIGTGTRAMKDIPLKEGAYFGERALLLDEPRAANVIATTDECVCLRLDRLSVVQLLGPLRELFDHNMCVNVLRSVPLLDPLTDDETDRLAEGFITATFEDGEEIVRQGDVMSAFYVIREGRVDVRRQAGGSTKSMLLASLSAGDYFGEQALLQENRQDHTIVAAGVVTCLVLDREVLEDLLGPLKPLLEREDGAAVSGQVQSVPEAASVVSASRASAGRSGAVKPLPLQSTKLEDYEIVAPLGVGTFGFVNLVKNRDGEMFALKTLHKARLVERHQEQNILAEKKCMQFSEHPFVLNLLATFNEATRLHMLLEYCPGGELFTLLTRRGWLAPPHARFYAASVFAAIRHVHELGFIYRDLKPENLLLDATGYVRLADFGFAKLMATSDRTYTICGTPDYLAPEVVSGEGYGKGADYWALGVLLYEMTCGESPFAAATQMDVFRNILHSNIDFPSDLKDRPLLDLIGQLLARKVVQRIGCRKSGANEIQSHPWIAAVPWSSLLAKTLPAPWVPKIAAADDTSNFDPEVAAAVADQSKNVPFEPDGSHWDADF